MSQQLNASRHFHLLPVALHHLESIASWYQNIDELSLIESNLPLPVNAQSLEVLWRRDLEQKAPRSSYLYTICNENDEAVGFTGLQEINLTNGCAVVFIFVEKNNRRFGLGKRSIALLLDMAFEQLRLHRVATYVNSDNLPSCDLIQKSGFTDEGRMREACFFNGEYHDVNIVSMLAEEWQALRIPLSDQLDNATTLSMGNDENSKWTWPLK
jgi:RimJ/RimL family protein N-acetyltransferase